MELIFSGILMGLLLSILLGPIFIVLVNLTLQHGRKAGFIASSGVWLSDLIIILLSYFFIQQVKDYLQSDSIKLILGIVGGLILIFIGISSLLKKTNFNQGAFAQKLGLKSVIEFFTKGFLVNTINPFTIFFWLTLMSTKVVSVGLSPNQTLVYIGSIFATIICTDSLKVLLAEKIRTKMKAQHFKWFSKIAGIGLLAIGIYFLIYALFLQ